MTDGVVVPTQIVGGRLCWQTRCTQDGCPGVEMSALPTLPGGPLTDLRVDGCGHPTKTGPPCDASAMRANVARDRERTCETCGQQMVKVGHDSHHNCDLYRCGCTT